MYLDKQRECILKGRYLLKVLEQEMDLIKIKLAFYRLQSI